MNADITMPENSINATFKLEVIPDITNLATKSEVAAVESAIPDVSGFATKTELSAVENQIPDISGLATKSEVLAVESAIPDVSGFATKQEVSDVEAQIPTVPTNVSAFTNDANYVNNTVLQENLLLSNALITGNVSDNQTVYADILSRYHSSFDSTKFTVTGSPTITDGVASNFTNSDRILLTNYDLTGANSWQIDFAFVYPSDNSGIQVLMRGNNAPTNIQSVFQNGVLYFAINTTNGFVRPNQEFSFVANTFYRGFVRFTGTKYESYITDGINDNLVSVNETAKITCNQPLYIGSYAVDGWAFKGSLDLKYWKVTADGTEIISGNKTGSDTYTIGGNTVTIPYTVTKNGAKIVDSAYRTAVQSVYNATGSVLYYTLDEENQNFTLPVGDLYGILQKLSDRITALET